MEEIMKPKTFLIHHKPTKHESAEVSRLSVPLRHLPENLSRITITCPACSSVLLPDWFKKHELPIVPVKPKFETKGLPYIGPKRWVLQSISQECPKCMSKIMISLPKNKMRTKVSLYGDDAERECKGRKVYLYSLVGADQSLLPAFKKKVQTLKQSVLPMLSPDGWKIHMKDMWAGNSRVNHPVYRSLTFNAVKNFVEQLLILIKESNLFIYNIALLSTGTSPKGNQLKNEAYIMLVLNAIDELTEKNAQPNIFFDSEKDSQANEIIHGWARDTFRGSQHSLLYGFLSKGIEVPEPKFVPPASYPGLEIADFVSFTIARFYNRKWEEKEIEIDPMKMGLVTYLGYDLNGDLLCRRQEGYPWEQFCH